MKIMSALMNKRDELVKTGDMKKPLLLKIAPDLSNAQLDDVVEIVNSTGIDGLVATNTTISRAGLSTPPSEVESAGAGGLSGEVLSKRSTEVIAYITRQSNRRIPVIGVGGIHNAVSAQQKMDAGATLLQVYSGFIYEGPALVKQVAKL
jgi:dihydroorotate dehydrogenase